MDPDACMHSLLTALRDKDFDGAADALENISDWLRRGGFFPLALPQAIDCFDSLNVRIMREKMRAAQK